MQPMARDAPVEGLRSQSRQRIQVHDQCHEASPEVCQIKGLQRKWAGTDEIMKHVMRRVIGEVSCSFAR